MKLMIDSFGYKNKPTSKTAGIINNRIINNPATVTVEKLASEIKAGKSFIPAYLKPVNGKIKRSKDYWSSQKIICLDFDEGMDINSATEEFKNNAAFIYKTYSHSKSEHKFRVVFNCNRLITKREEFDIIIEHLLKKYPTADQQCKDCTRIFYGTNHPIIKINYENKLDIDSILYNLKIDDKNHINTVKTSNSSLSPLILLSEHSGVNLLEDKNFHHIDDAYDYIYQQNMTQFILDSFPDGQYDRVDNKSFCCIFHADKNPSAGIFKDNKTGVWFYKCHSQKCGVRCNIVTLTQKIFKVGRVASFHILCNYFGIKIIESDWQRQQKEILDHNISFLSGPYFEEEYPLLYKKIKTYIPMLIMINMFSKQFIGSNRMKKIESNVFYCSRQEVSLSARTFEEIIKLNLGLEKAKINRDVKEIGKRFDLFVFLGLINKLGINDVPEDMKNDAIKNKEEKKHRYFQNFYAIEEYDDERLTLAGNKTIQLKENNISMAGFGRESIIRNLGNGIANEVYPMTANEELSDVSYRNSNKVARMFIEQINQHGFVKESDILNKLIKESEDNFKVKARNKNLSIIKKSLNEIIQTYGFDRIKINKKVKAQLSYLDLSSIASNSIIIYRPKNIKKGDSNHE